MMKHYRAVAAAGLLTVALIAQAGAFPGWMGVYGGVERHDDAANPGKFTVLLNEDYYGLQAAVTLRVNGGPWREFNMDYAGRKDINSVWEFTPAFEFPPGARVEYFFKGWDDSGSAIYDNQPGNDYHFYAANYGGMTMPALEELGVISSMTQAVGYAESGVYRLDVKEREHSPGTWYLSLWFKDAAGGDWSFVGVPYEVNADGLNIQSFMIDDRVLVIRTYDVMEDLGGINPLIHRSVDGGRTWGGLMQEPVTGGQLLIVGENLVRVNQDGTVQHLAHGSTAWGDPVSTRASGVSMIKSSGKTILGTARYGMDTVFSFDGGFTWTKDTPDSLQQVDAIYVLEGKLYVVGSTSDPEMSGMRVWSRGPEDSEWNLWSGPLRDISTFEVRYGKLKILPGDILVFCDTGGFIDRNQVHNTVSYQISTDRGQSWSPKREHVLYQGLESSLYVGNPMMVSDDTYVIQASLQVGDDEDRLFQRYVGYMRFTDSLDDRIFWAGDVHHWPLKNVIETHEDLWINASVWPAGRAVNAYAQVAIFGPNVTPRLASLPMEPNGTSGDIELWHLNLGQFPENTSIAYSVMVEDGVGAKVLEEVVGQEHLVRTTPKPIYWAGNVSGRNRTNYGKYRYEYHSVMVETWPQGGAVSAYVVYSTDGVIWRSSAMRKTGTQGNNDVWTFQDSGHCGANYQCAILVIDGLGQEHWVTNGGNNYWLFQ